MQHNQPLRRFSTHAELIAAVKGVASANQRQYSGPAWTWRNVRLDVAFENNMTFSEFTSLVAQNPDGVILLEGRRTIPEAYAAKAEHLARGLATRFTDLRFRSGNAEGADQAFSKGIASVDPRRLQVVAPYASHRKSLRYADAIYDSPDSLSAVREDEVAFKTSSASPKNKGLIAKRNQTGPLAAKAAYLIRDTMKVTGYSEAFPKPICALFYVSMDDPLAGGTGHTIRVCQQEGVPFACQDSWENWPV